MVVKNLILPPRHASHRGPALPAIHSFSHLRVSRPLTRRLDRPPLSSPTILQPSVRERERERERERREKREEKSRCSGRKERGATHASQIACLACAVWPGRFQGGPGSQRWKRASHRAQQPTRRIPPSPTANASRLTALTSQHAALQQGTTLLSPLPGAFVQAQRVAPH